MPEMNLKETIENNIIIVLVTVSVAVAGTTFSVVNYHNNQKLLNLEHSLNIKCKKLESKIASIERDVPGIKHFDIRGMFLPQSETSAIDPALSYFKDDRFYASKTDEYWKYSHTNEIELMELILGKKLDSGPFKILAQKAKKFPIHLWKTDETITMIRDGEKTNWFPHIFLQRISNDKIGEIIGVGTSFAEWIGEDDDFDFNDEDLNQTEDVEKFLEAMNKAFYTDAAGMFFLFQNLISFQSSIISPNETYRIKKIQKLGNILYSQYVTEYSDVEVSGNNTTVYLQQELMIVSERDDFYLIKITLPSTEPNARIPAYAHINSWLSDIKFVRN